MIKFFKISAVIFSFAIMVSSCSNKGIAVNSFKQEMYADQDFMASAKSTPKASVISSRVIKAESKQEPVKTIEVNEVNTHKKHSVYKNEGLNTTINSSIDFVKAPIKEKNKVSGKEVRKSNPDKKFTGGQKALLVLVALIFPFVSVAIVDGFDIHFWLALIFSILLGLPGIIYAILRIFRH